MLVNQCLNSNEVFTECGPVDYCEATCRDPDLIAVACPRICVQKCVCNDGFLRDDDGNCVEKNSCPIKQCGDNEEYLSCGSGCGDLTCENPSYTNMTCPDFCNEGCFCVEGYVRKYGKCIPSSDCEMSCPANEIYTPCGAKCEPTCENPNRNNMICPFICLEGCICDEGFVRSNGSCIPARDCPKGEANVKR